MFAALTHRVTGATQPLSYEKKNSLETHWHSLGARNVQLWPVPVTQRLHDWSSDTWCTWAVLGLPCCCIVRDDGVYIVYMDGSIRVWRDQPFTLQTPQRNRRLRDNTCTLVGTLTVQCDGQTATGIAAGTLPPIHWYNAPLVFVARDCVEWNGTNITHMQLQDRLIALKTLISGVDPTYPPPVHVQNDSLQCRMSPYIASSQRLACSRDIPPDMRTLPTHGFYCATVNTAWEWSPPLLWSKYSDAFYYTHDGTLYCGRTSCGPAHGCIAHTHTQIVHMEEARGAMPDL